VFSTASREAVRAARIGFADLQALALFLVRLDDSGERLAIETTQTAEATEDAAERTAHCFESEVRMYTMIQHILGQPATTQVRPSDAERSTLFEEALRDPSNLELDWLWLAAQLTRAGEQSYCLHQALRINPRSELAKRGLAEFARRPDAPLELKAWSQHAWQER